MTARIVRRNRRTGSEIEVCTAESQDLDPDGGKWVTICWTHGRICSHDTLRIAASHAPYPDDWCEGYGPSCRDVWEAKQKG